MIVFACAREGVLPEIQRYGLRFSGLGHKLYRSLEGARRDCSAKILVIELGEKELAACTVKEQVVVAPLVPLGCFRNLNPYLPPVGVTAGGGLVVRKRRGRFELVCIHRRSVWDLPKGKKDQDESIESCALREVREELGVDAVELVGAAGETAHGYMRGRAYHVKTTHWFWMKTSEKEFRPQEEEQIDEVSWIPWTEAAAKVGYRTLRVLLRSLNPAKAAP